MSNVTRMLLPLLILIAVLCQSLSAQVADTATPRKQESSKPAKQDEIDAAKKADIKKLLVATGAGNMGMQVVNQMVNMQRRQNPNVPKEFWDDFLSQVSGDELIDLTIPAYAKHLTHDEIKELIKFYESPVGKKLVKVQPQIMQESMVAGQKWGMDLGRRIAEQLKSKDFLP